MSTPTSARTKSNNSSHWYAPDGTPKYQIPTVDGKKMKVPTLADAKKQGFLPSVTTVIDAILRKPALEAWKTEQAVLACLTAPRKEGEETDAFVHRVLQEEMQHMEEAKTAAELGTRIHNAIESFFQGEAMPDELKPWVMPAVDAILERFGKPVATEKILVGDGYAGKTDLLTEVPVCWWLLDFKATKKLPDKGAWSEHRLQLSAYAAALEREHNEQAPQNKPIKTANVYISTTTEGKFVIAEHEPWLEVYQQGFLPLLQHWQWANKYWTQAPKDGYEITEKGKKLVDAIRLVEDATHVRVPAPLVPIKEKRKIVWSEGVPTPPPAAA